jgi:hypothetical protein
MIDLSVTSAQELDGAARGPAEEDGLPSVRSLAWLVQPAQAKLSARRDREVETEHRRASGDPVGKSLAPEMKYRGGALHVFGRETAVGAVNGLRPGARFIT